MIPSSLRLPEHSRKPRRTGITMMIDTGLPLGHFRDVVSSMSSIVDYVKFGWGTALVTERIEEKMRALVESEVSFFFGGTLFEKYVSQDRFDDFVDLCRSCGLDTVEVSNGTIGMSNLEKASYIHKLAGEFTVLSEVGFKDPTRSELLAAPRWVEFIEEDLEAGARLVITEARESGRSGTCLPDGRLRVGLIEELVERIDPTHLLFEAPTTALQTYFVTRLGPEVNLGNIAPADLVSLETLRLGLRADTLELFG